VYNLTVDEAHTYFVGDGAWLVHNSCNPKDQLDTGKELSRKAREVMNVATRMNGGDYPNIVVAASVDSNNRVVFTIGSEYKSDIQDWTRWLSAKGHNVQLPSNFDNISPGNGRTHAEQLMYEYLGKPEKAVMGVNTPQGPCVDHCRLFFTNHNVTIVWQDLPLGPFDYWYFYQGKAKPID